MAQVKLSAPWVEHYRKIQAMFAQDPDVRVIFDEEEMIVKVCTPDSGKAEALHHLLLPTVTFGNVELKVVVPDPNDRIVMLVKGKETGPDKAYLFFKAFYNNPAFVTTKYVCVGDVNLQYVIFDKKVVQYFNDNISDPNGLCSTLYQEIAKDIFFNDGVFYCTSDKAVNHYE